MIVCGEGQLCTDGPGDVCICALAAEKDVSFSFSVSLATSLLVQVVEE